MKDRQAEALRWLQQARADFAVVQTLKQAGHYAAACFHSQQAAEKALKAVRYHQGQRFVLGHSVRELARQCQTVDTAFAGLENEGALLDQFYIPTRYPNGLPFPAVPSESYTESQARSAEEAAGRVIQAVEGYFSVLDQAVGKSEQDDQEAKPGLSTDSAPSGASEEVDA